MALLSHKSKTKRNNVKVVIILTMLGRCIKNVLNGCFDFIMEMIWYSQSLDCVYQHKFLCTIVMNFHQHVHDFFFVLINFKFFLSSNFLYRQKKLAYNVLVLTNSNMILIYIYICEYIRWVEKCKKGNCIPKHLNEN